MKLTMSTNHTGFVINKKFMFNRKTLFFLNDSDLQVQITCNHVDQLQTNFSLFCVVFIVICLPALYHIVSGIDKICERISVIIS